jgi:hypothetical protein
MLVVRSVTSRQGHRRNEQTGIALQQLLLLSDYDR